MVLNEAELLESGFPNSVNHEALGHALGVGGHSPDDMSSMYYEYNGSVVEITPDHLACLLEIYPPEFVLANLRQGD